MKDKTPTAPTPEAPTVVTPEPVAAPMDAISAAKVKFSTRFSTHIKVDPKGQHGYPAPVKKGSPEEDLVRMWKAQKRAFCKDERCYYPLNPKLLEEVGFELQTVVGPSGEKLIVGECSYDPRHAGGVQLYAQQKRDGTEE